MPLPYYYDYYEALFDHVCALTKNQTDRYQVYCLHHPTTPTSGEPRFVFVPGSITYLLRLTELFLPDYPITAYVRLVDGRVLRLSCDDNHLVTMDNTGCRYVDLRCHENLLKGVIEDGKPLPWPLNGLVNYFDEPIVELITCSQQGEFPVLPLTAETRQKVLPYPLSFIALEFPP